MHQHNMNQLDPAARDFYRQSMAVLEEAGVPFLVGGAYAFERHTGIARHTKDFDLFLRPDDVDQALAAFAAAGYRTEVTFPHWLAKAWRDDELFVDLIYGSGNGVAAVDEAWFTHAPQVEVLGRPARVCPAEEMVWSKAFIMERERFDGADVAHLILACGARFDWDRLLMRFGPHWRVLLAHLVLFGYIYPSERGCIPDDVLDELLTRAEFRRAPHHEKVCRGTILSRGQYLTDVEQRGFEDGRVSGHFMSEEDVERWTAGIAVDGSR